MRQVTIDRDREWLKAIKFLLEDRNARVEEGVVIIFMIMVRAIVSAIFRNVITTIVAATKISQNLAELVHITLLGDKAGDIGCRLLLRGAIPSQTLALICISSPVSTIMAF